MSLFNVNVLNLYQELLIDQEEKDFFFDLFHRGHEELRDWMEMSSQDVNASGHYYNMTIN